MVDLTVDADRFAYGFSKLLEDIGPGVDDALEPAVRKGVQTARKVAKATAPVGPSRHEPGEYRDSLTYTVKKRGGIAEGEVGSKKFPGLVHLLEKGHARVGGGSVGPREHMATGFDAGVPEFQRELLERVARVLAG